MPLIIIIIVIFFVLKASKSNQNSNNGISNNKPLNTANQPNPYSNQMRQASQPNPYSNQNWQASRPNPYSSQNRQASQPNPYSNQNRQASQPNPYSNQNWQASQPNPYSNQNQQDLNKLKERLSLKYSAQLQNKSQTINTQTSGRTPVNQQKPAGNTAPGRNDNQRTERQDMQQPDVPNTPQTENTSTIQSENTGSSYAYSAVTPLSTLVSQDFLSLGTTNTLVLAESPSSLMMGISNYDFSFWGIGVDGFTALP